MAGTELAELGLGGLAALVISAERAAGVKLTAGGKGQGVGNVSTDGFEPALFLTKARQRTEQSLSVWMEGLIEEGLDGGVLDDFAGVHDGDGVGDLGDDGEVVSDQHDGHLLRGLELAQEIEDLGLDGHVQSCGGLVGDEHSGMAGKGHGDHNPLTQPAAELVGIGVEALAGRADADTLERFDGQLAGLGPAELLMELDGFDDLIAHGEDGVEAGHRLLEDHGDFVAADFAHLSLGEFEQVSAFEEDFAGDYFSGRRRDQPHYAQSRDAFSAAAFTDDAQGLPSLDLPGNIINRPDQTVLGAKVGGDIFYQQQITQGLASI